METQPKDSPRASRVIDGKGIGLVLAPMIVLATWSGFINTLSVLDCQRSQNSTPEQSQCTLERGSMFFHYTERFRVSDIVTIRVEPLSLAAGGRFHNRNKIPRTKRIPREV